MEPFKTLLTRLVFTKDKSKSAVARKLGISSQLLGQYMSGRQMPKAEFFMKWKLVFGEDLLPAFETYVSRPGVREPEATYIPKKETPLPEKSTEELISILKEDRLHYKSQVDTFTQVIIANLTTLLKFQENLGLTGRDTLGMLKISLRRIAQLQAESTGRNLEEILAEINKETAIELSEETGRLVYINGKG